MTNRWSVYLIMITQLKLIFTINQSKHFHEIIDFKTATNEYLSLYRSY